MRSEEQSRQETVTCAIRLPVPLLVYLKRLARRLSIDCDRDVTYGDLVREACAKAYPLKEEGEQKG